MNGYHCLSYHCLNCGEKLKQLSMNLSTDKYECPKCCTTWYRVRHIIGQSLFLIEWVEEKKGRRG
jgi:DNA-directed RNA polymerase subunit RPC12/RpoP